MIRISTYIILISPLHKSLKHSLAYKNKIIKHIMTGIMHYTKFIKINLNIWSTSTTLTSSSNDIQLRKLRIARVHIFTNHRRDIPSLPSSRGSDHRALGTSIFTSLRARMTNIHLTQRRCPARRRCAIFIKRARRHLNHGYDTREIKRACSSNGARCAHSALERGNR